MLDCILCLFCDNINFKENCDRKVSLLCFAHEHLTDSAAQLIQIKYNHIN